MKDGSLIRFSRRFESSRVCGYVLDVGPRFFLLAVVQDRIWFDGFECLRIADVEHLEPDRYAGFVEAALRKRKERKPGKPRVKLDRLEDCLRSAGLAFPLVTIHREEVDCEVCQIGRVIRVERGRVLLLEIRPDATWEEQPTRYRLNEITRIDFGGDYEEALDLVAGTPPRVTTPGTSPAVRRPSA